MSSVSTQPRIAELRARDPEALTAIVNEHLPTLLAGALAAGLSRPDAEEVVQETFVAFLSGLDRFEGRSSVRTYLFGILYHKASNLRAKSRRWVEQCSEGLPDAQRAAWSTPHGDDVESFKRRVIAGLGRP